MNTRNHHWLLLSRGGMELSWRYAWALFTALLAVQLTFPLHAAVCAMVLGAVTTRISVARNFRNYQRITFQSACFVLTGLLIIYWSLYTAMPFWHFDWVRHLLLEAKSLSRWLILLVLVFFLCLFWQGGRLLVKESGQYLPVCLQFDKGLALFIVLLIVYALVDVRTGLNLQNRDIRFAILAFFAFSLVSIVLARHQTPVQKSFISGYHGIGVILSTLIMAAIFATGITLMAYPYLYHKADALLVILKNTATPFEPWLIKILMFLFKPRHLRQSPDIQDKSTLSVKEAGVPVVEDWQVLLLKIVGVGLAVLIGLALISALAYLIYRLALWLSKRDPESVEPMGLVKSIRRFLKACLVFLLQIWKKTVELMKGADSAAMIYHRLLRWGRYSGLPAISSDTPSEYGRRLIQSFPALKSEIQIIVEAFNRELYGRTAIDRQTLVRLISAYRCLRHLKHWPSRMKTWFFQSK